MICNKDNLLKLSSSIGMLNELSSFAAIANITSPTDLFIIIGMKILYVYYF